MSALHDQSSLETSAVNAAEVSAYTDLREHVSDGSVTCADCGRRIARGGVYVAPWFATPSPVDPDEEDFVCDADAPVYCAACVMTSRVLNRVPEDDGPFRGSRKAKYIKQSSDRPPVPPPLVPPRRRRGFLGSVVIAVVLAALVLFAWVGLRSLAGPPNQGCPEGTERADSGLVVTCDRQDGSTLCQVQPGTIDGEWTWPRCSGLGATIGTERNR